MLNEISSQKFFLYARKSTDVEDKQVLSIEALLFELREFAKRESIEILEELIEKQSAKVPGRPIFNLMISRIERYEASGILSWNPDRLARNSIDGGRIIYLIDTGQIKSLMFPTFSFEPTPQGKFMLQVLFGQSKYYVDSLAENTKRGLRQKVRRGEFPGRAPVGYINDIRNKTIVVDKRLSPIVKEALELFVTGNYCIKDIAGFLTKKGILSSNNKPHTITWVTKNIITNPFYYGHFRYGGEVHEGIHEPIITKKLFDQVQEVFNRRTKPWPKIRVPKPYLGLLSCGECGMMITAEIQKGHTYYRCTKKSKNYRCNQSYIRQEELDTQISKMIKTASLRADWAKSILNKIDKEEKDVAQSTFAFVQTKKEQLKEINSKLQFLLDSYLDQIIDRESYSQKKSELLSKKKTIEEQISTFEQKQNNWLEPMRAWVHEAAGAVNIASGDNLNAKKVLALKIWRW